MRGAAAFEARTDDGVVLRGDVVLPEAPPRAVAVLAHAMMVTRRVMDRPSGAGLASALASRGLAVVNADLRGHGESGPRADEGATYAYDDFVTRDVTALVAAARARFPGLPVAVVGHSLGGHAAAIAAGLDPANAPDAIVALAANLWLPKLEPSRARRVLKRSMFAGWLRLAERKGYFDPRPLKLGNNPEPLAYIRQFVRMFEEDHITSADGRVDYEAALARARVPILSIASDGDRLLGHPESVRRFFDLCGAAAVTHRRVVHFDYAGRAPSHMGLVTDARSLPLWHECARFVLEHAAAPSSASVA